MLRRDALVAAVQRLPTQPLEGVAFRLILARYAATALSSIGSLRTGGRYNVRGRFEALRVPSARDPSTDNLVVLPDRLRAGSSLRVFDDSGLIDALLPRGRPA